MTQLINLAPAGQEPAYVNVSNLAACVQENGNAYLCMTDGSAKLPNTDLDTVADALKQAGHDLFVLRGRNANGAPETALIAPRAITFATVSQPDENGNVGVLLGVKGLGRYNIVMPVHDWSNILSALKSGDRALLSFDAEDAHARWTCPQQLHIFPDSISRIYGDGHERQLNVFISGYGVLDVKIATFQQADDLLQQRYGQWRDQNPSADMRDDAVFGKISRQIEKEVEQVFRGRRAALAQKLAQAAGTLVAVLDDNAERSSPIYMSPSDIDIVYAGQTRNPVQYTLHIEKSESGHNYNQHVTAYFNDSAKRDAALANLQQQLSARGQAAQKKLQK